MLNVIYWLVQAIGLTGLLYGAWLVYTNRDLWRDREHDRRRHPRDAHEGPWDRKRRADWRSNVV
jgi:hypothetical protein